ncbi:MAG TPA: GDYXXLXY domain-containing protein [Mycobacteriales bacterium]|nr:GDYXXLXY domain-containing protein [Mycobacteriales bacterium]
MAVAVQAVLLVVAVAPRLSARLMGDEYLVRVAPVDPIDPFRGAYVRLQYPDLLSDDAAGRREDERVFIPLVRDGGLWRGGGLLADRPEDGPYLACRYDGGLRCGIESLFLSQTEARSLERDLASGGGVARLRVDGRGHAAVVAVEPG